MIKTMTAKQWFDQNVNVDKLRDSVLSSMQEAINYESIEDDTYIALVHDVVNGANGVYTPFYALEYFGYELNTNNIEQYDFDSTYWELDTFTSELEDIINEALAIDYVNVGFGYWDADGSFCLMAFMDRSNLEETDFEYESEVV